MTLTKDTYEDIGANRRMRSGSWCLLIAKNKSRRSGTVDMIMAYD